MLPQTLECREKCAWLGRGWGVDMRLSRVRGTDVIHAFMRQAIKTGAPLQAEGLKGVGYRAEDSGRSPCCEL